MRMRAVAAHAAGPKNHHPPPYHQPHPISKTQKKHMARRHPPPHTSRLGHEVSAGPRLPDATESQCVTARRVREGASRTPESVTEEQREISRFVRAVREAHSCRAAGEQSNKMLCAGMLCTSMCGAPYSSWWGCTAKARDR